MNWTISQLDRTLPDGVVYTAHWRVSATDGNFSGSVYGTQSFDDLLHLPIHLVRQGLSQPNDLYSQSFDAKDPSDPDFIPYDQLTEAQVVQWVKEAMGADTVAAHEAAVQAQIDAQKNPTNAAGVPW